MSLCCVGQVSWLMAFASLAFPEIISSGFYEERTT
ncbi:hypothetical protein PSE_4329 [Pseudovibrio sp. FO-BEG1]|nr:hypothetical protein PSE_4329 [Pseudovibrio sp. FO-BEG1]